MIEDILKRLKKVLMKPMIKLGIKVINLKYSIPLWFWLELRIGTKMRIKYKRNILINNNQAINQPVSNPDPINIIILILQPFHNILINIIKSIILLFYINVL